MKSDKGYVYLICDNGHDVFKIGVTKGTIENRIKKLQTGNATELFISKYYHTKYPFKLETMLHARFRNKQVLNEWFALDIDDVTNFENTCDKLESDIEALKENPFFVGRGIR